MSGKQRGWMGALLCSLMSLSEYNGGQHGGGAPLQHPPYLHGPSFFSPAVPPPITWARFGAMHVLAASLQA